MGWAQAVRLGGARRSMCARHAVGACDGVGAARGVGADQKVGACHGIGAFQGARAGYAVGAGRSRGRLRRMGGCMQLGVGADHGADAGQTSDLEGDQPPRGAPRRAQGLAWDEAEARLFIADSGSNAVRLADVASGVVRTLAGRAEREADSGADNVAALDADLLRPTGLAYNGSSRQLFVSTGGHRVRRVDLASGGASTSCRGAPRHARRDVKNTLRR